MVKPWEPSRCNIPRALMQLCLWWLLATATSVTAGPAPGTSGGRSLHALWPQGGRRGGLGQLHDVERRIEEAVRLQKRLEAERQALLRGLPPGVASTGDKAVPPSAGASDAVQPPPVPSDDPVPATWHRAGDGCLLGMEGNPNCVRTAPSQDTPARSGDSSRGSHAAAPAPPRVYVYELPPSFNRDLVRKYKRCASDQYGTEVFFHEAFLTSHVRTRMAEEADFFFVPIYGECFLWSHEMLRGESHATSFSATNEFFLEALDIVFNSYPFWNRSGGQDHIFSFPGARGPTIFEDWRRHIPLSLFLTPEGDRTLSYFNTWKDIVVPGMEADPTFFLDGSGKLPPHEAPRKTLAYFRGTIFHKEGNAYSRGLRPRLAEIFANQSDIIYDTKVKGCDRQCYWEEMAASTFCLCPLGWTPWTLRFYQAVMVRCIPVVIADNIEFPFENTIDYSKFAIKIPANEVDNIVTLMRNMPVSEILQKRQVMEDLWLAFTYQRPPQPGDAFHMVLNELSRKTREFKTSSSYSWL